MLAVFLDTYRREWTGARGPLTGAYRDAALGLVFAFNAWHAWTRRTALPAELDWRLGVAAFALAAASFLYSAWQGYGQVLGL